MSPTDSKFESIFETVRSRHKIYCIEASAATHSILQHIKRHVIQILHSPFQRGDNVKFNILCFNSDVSKWCVSMAPCTDEYVTAAEEWLRHIQSLGSCNLLAAIVSALKEPVTCSLCIIATQHPNQDVDEILDLFAFIGRKAPCHIRLCLLGNAIPEDIKNAHEVYNQIATETGGSFAFVKLDNNDELHVINSTKNILDIEERAMIASLTDTNASETEVIKRLENRRIAEKRQLFSTPLWSFKSKVPDDLSSPEIPPMRTWSALNYQPFDLWKRVSASKQYLEWMHNFHQTNISNMASGQSSTLAGSLIVGRQVLARNYVNGQYYVGYVKEQISNELFNVVFGPYDWSKGQYVATDYQQTRLLDLIDLSDAIKRSVLPGDRVLAPDPTSTVKDQYLCRYLTGTVLDGAVIREYGTSVPNKHQTHDGMPAEIPSKTTDYLVIEFTNPLNKTERVLSDKVLYIPEPFFQRLCLEGAMPKSAREKLYNIPNYPLNSLPGYPTSGSKKSPTDYTFTNLNVVKSRTLQVDYLMPPYCLPLYPVVEILEKDERTGNVTTKSDWETPNIVKKTGVSNKNDTLVPESLYTVSELQMKVEDQLETFKDLYGNQAHGDKTYFQKSVSKATEIRPGKSLYLKAKEKHTKPLKTVSRASDELTKHSLKSPMFTFSNYSIHEEYFDEIKKIRDEGPVQDASHSSSLFDSSRKSENPFAADIRKTKHNIPSSQKGTHNSNVINISDLGQRDKERELIEKTKLERHQRQIQNRLDNERYKYCDEERAKDEHLYFYRQKEAERIHKENQILQQEQEKVDKCQSLKRAVLTEVENKVETVKFVPQSLDDIDDNRIHNLKNRMESRANEKTQQDQDALRYVEKLEESKKNRNDARWWKAQDQMLKEFPSAS